MRIHRKHEGTKIPDIETQHLWMKEYSVNSIELGQLCFKYPALKNSWKQFQTIYKLCKEEHELGTKIS